MTAHEADSVCEKQEKNDAGGRDGVVPEVPETASSDAGRLGRDDHGVVPTTQGLSDRDAPREHAEPHAGVKRTSNPTVDARKTIFLVTVMKPGDLEGREHRERTWGWYSRFEDAEAAVLRNSTDMFEANYYDHAVIEEAPEGIIPVARARGWYRAAYEDDDDGHPKVTKIDAPEWSKDTCNWGIG